MSGNETRKRSPSCDLNEHMGYSLKRPQLLSRLPCHLEQQQQQQDEKDNEDNHDESSSSSSSSSSFSSTKRNQQRAYQLGGNVYRIKKHVTDKVRKILKYYRNLRGDKKVTNEAHKRFLTDLLEWHPNAAEKKGVGIIDFVVDRSERDTDCFHILRKDGSKVEFGYPHCITAMQKTIVD